MAMAMFDPDDAFHVERLEVRHVSGIMIAKCGTLEEAVDLCKILNDALEKLAIHIY